MPSTLLSSRRRFLQGATVAAAGYASGCSSSNLRDSQSEPLSLANFISGMPKAELHVHLEGTLEPAAAMKIAAGNGSRAPYDTVEAYEAALNFNSLESFLEAFHKTISVLKTEEDFYEITSRYLAKSRAQNVLHVDIKFDPQAHLRRGIAFDAFFSGINQARREAERDIGVSSGLIMCFQRDAPLETAELAYAEALERREHIVGIGLDNTEIPGFPGKFVKLFRHARSAGFKLTSHCDLGQPNSVEHIRACIEDLAVDRLDHGYNVLEDQELVKIARDRQICFTACPTSAFNTPDPSSRYYFSEVCRAVGEMLDLGLNVTINTDDPGVMGARYLNQVIEEAVAHMQLDRPQVIELAANSFRSLWIPNDKKQQYLTQLAGYASKSIAPGNS